MHKPRSCLTVVPENSPSNVKVFAEYRPTLNASPFTVLVEWKDYYPEGSHRILIAQRVDNLARLLSREIPKPVDFRVLACLAYVEDNRLPRFGFTYELPANVVSSPPISLLHLLSRGQDTRVPDLGERFSLAQALAISFMRLHDCGWMHGALRSSNIVFFEHQHTRIVSLREPYIMGITYSRPSDPSESTLEYSQSSLENDLYRHPDVGLFLQQNRPRVHYRLYHDFYSLGIIVLEIGLWEQVRAPWKDYYTPERFLQKLLDGYVPKLGAKMGAVYRDVVKALMSMDTEFPGQEQERESGEKGNPSPIRQYMY